MTERNLKTLIVEDVPEILNMMEFAIRAGVIKEPTPIRLSRKPQEKLREYGVDVAESYMDAKGFIESKVYDFIFLDHNLPYKMGCETEDIGYGLIAVIKDKNPNTTVIGTSSKREVRNHPGLDLELDKTSLDLEKRLAEVYSGHISGHIPG